MPLLVFNFPFHKHATEYPESGTRINFGRGWNFASAPEAPDQREFSLKFRGMKYFTGPNGLADPSVWPGMNAYVMEKFYQNHQLHRPFWYYHPNYGYVRCRFKEPLRIPFGHEGGDGLLEEFEVRFVEIPGVVGLGHPDSPPLNPPILPLLPGQWGILNDGLPDGFDAMQYVASHPDLIIAIGADQEAAETHYLTFGRFEGRVIDNFDAAQYLENYADLRALFGTDENAATIHYIQFGFAEGRTDRPIDTGEPGDDTGGLQNEAGAFILTETDFYIIPVS